MSSYLERCIETAQSIDGAELADLQFGDIEGHGYFFDFRRLGNLIIQQKDQEVGLKIPNTVWTHAKTRVIQEMAFIDLVVDASPEAITYVPSFISLVRVEDSVALAVLTEDATNGGEKDIDVMRASATTRQMLYKPFMDLGSESSVLDGMACIETVAFDVGGQERLLDFDPPPLQLGIKRESDAYEDTEREVKRAIDDLTITIPRESILGEALLSYM